MADNKKSFILYCDQRGIFERLSNEQAGSLIKHIFSYVSDENPEADFVTELAFESIKSALKRDLKKFEQIKLKRVEAGRKGGKQTQANQASATSAKANQAVNDNVSDSVSVTVKEIVNYLNTRASSNYKHTTDKTKNLIKARSNEGFTLDDFKTVIDKKTLQWLNDPEMSKYLRPETLFGSKFEGYLNEQAATETATASSILKGLNL